MNTASTVCTICRQVVSIATVLQGSIRGHIGAFPKHRCTSQTSRTDRATHTAQLQRPATCRPKHQAVTAVEAGGYAESCTLQLRFRVRRASLPPPNLPTVETAQPWWQAGPQPQTTLTVRSRGTSCQSSAQIAQGVTHHSRRSLAAPVATGRLLPDMIRDDSLGRKGGSGRFEGVWDTYRGI